MNARYVHSPPRRRQSQHNGWEPARSGFPAEARPGAREAAARMKNPAERFAGLRNAIMCLPTNPSRDDRAGLRHRLLHLENTLMSPRGAPTTPSSPSRTPTTPCADNPRGPCRARSDIRRANSCRRAMPPTCHAANSPARLDRRAGEFGESEEKGDAPRGKESSLRGASRPHQPEMPDVRFHS